MTEDKSNECIAFLKQYLNTRSLLLKKIHIDGYQLIHKLESGFYIVMHLLSIKLSYENVITKAMADSW